MILFMSLVSRLLNSWYTHIYVYIYFNIYYLHILVYSHEIMVKFRTARYARVLKFIVREESENWFAFDIITEAT